MIKNLSHHAEIIFMIKSVEIVQVLFVVVVSATKKPHGKMAAILEQSHLWSLQKNSSFNCVLLFWIEQHLLNLYLKKETKPKNSKNHKNIRHVYQRPTQSVTHERCVIIMKWPKNVIFFWSFTMVSFNVYCKHHRYFYHVSELQF